MFQRSWKRLNSDIVVNVAFYQHFSKAMLLNRVTVALNERVKGDIGNLDHGICQRCTHWGLNNTLNGRRMILSSVYFLKCIVIIHNVRGHSSSYKNTYET